MMMECPTCKGAGQIKATLGMRLRAFRKARGLSIAEVSQKTGLGSSMLSALENDNSKNPSLKSVIAVAKLYNTTVDELVADNGDS